MMNNHSTVRLFSEIEGHLLGDKEPSAYLSQLLKNDIFVKEYPFTLLSALTRTEQSPKYHPEGSVWNHTLLVTDLAARYKVYSGDERVFMWSALLHDIGKPKTTMMRKGRLTSYNHETEGRQLAAAFLEAFSFDSDFISRVSLMVRWHMEALHFTKDRKKHSAKELLSEVPLRDITLLSLCDRLGRGRMTAEKIAEEKKGLKLFVQSLRQPER